MPSFAGATEWLGSEPLGAAGLRGRVVMISGDVAPPTLPVSLRPMRETEFSAFRDAFIRAWAADLRRVEGLSEDEAIAEARMSIHRALPASVSTPDAHLFVVEAEGRAVGTLWLEIDHHGNAHIADVTIDDGGRGRGFGGRALELAETEARRLGAASIALNVYDDNDGARRLYDRLGYRPVRHLLRKPLPGG